MSDKTIPFGRPWIDDGDREAVLKVLEGPILAHGPQCKAFEQEFGQILGDEAHCVSVSSCTAALHLAYFHLGIGPGDEVIVPAQTHTATAHAVELVGAKPVFVDCELTTGNVTAEAIAAAITERTKALSVVHFLGIPCNMAAITDLARQRDLKVVEDCALAIGTRYQGRHAGLWGDMGCFSFYPVKHLTTGEGGMFVSRHPQVAASVSKQRAFGVDRSYAERTLPGMYDVVKLGFNYRMSDINAALGRHQLTKVPEILKRRRKNFEQLKSLLWKIENVVIIDSPGEEYENSYYCLSVVLQGALKPHRNAIATALKAMGVGTSIYYPQPVPRMKYYREKYGYRPEDYPNAAAISDGSIALPVGPHVSSDDIEFIARSLEKTIKETHT